MLHDGEPTADRIECKYWIKGIRADASGARASFQIRLFAQNCSVCQRDKTRKTMEGDDRVRAGHHHRARRTVELQVANCDPRAHIVDEYSVRCGTGPKGRFVVERFSACDEKK